MSFSCIGILAVLRYLPNIITVIRMGLVFPLWWKLTNHMYDSALVIFLIAGFSDGLDGFLARKYSWSTRFGTISDPIADKLLLITTVTGLWFIQVLPTWFFMLSVFRDLWVFSGALMYHYCFGPYRIAPHLSGKLNTFFQVLLLSANLFALVGTPFPPQVLFFLLITSAVMCATSLTDYTYSWSVRALQAYKKRKNSAE